MIGIIIFLCALCFSLIIAAVIVIIKHAPESKGKRGENIVAHILGDTISGEQYVINDLLFSRGANQSCQIDHIYINRHGIWVIETKNYSGKIYGDESQHKWTQVLANGKTKNKFYNPVKQNQTHIYHLSQVLQVKNIFINTVVFLDKADISSINSSNVIALSQLEDIKSTETGINLSAEQMEEYYNKLAELKNSSLLTKKEHLKIIDAKQKQLKKGVCPRCGGELVIRNGKLGKFYGCSNFPECTFTKNIDKSKE